MYRIKRQVWVSAIASVTKIYEIHNPIQSNDIVNNFQCSVMIFLKMENTNSNGKISSEGSE